MISHAEAIIGIYRRHCDTWDRTRGRALFEQPWLDAFMSLLPTGGHVLDIGCGGGEPIARYLIECGYRVLGLDASPGLIKLCQQRFGEQEWFVADMRQLSLGRQFDGLLAWDSFFHLCPDDQRRMFAVFNQHAAPRSALMFTSGPSYGEAIGTFEGEPLYHASLGPAEYRRLLAEHGFAVVAHTVEDPACGHHTIWLARRS